MPDKDPKPVKLSKSPFKYANMTPIRPGDVPIPTKKEMYDQLVRQMTGMSEQEIKNMADIIVNMIIEIRDLKHK